MLAAAASNPQLMNEASNTQGLLDATASMQSGRRPATHKHADGGDGDFGTERDQEYAYDAGANDEKFTANEDECKE